MFLRVLSLILLLTTTPVRPAEPAEKSVPAPAKGILTPAQKTAAYAALKALLKMEAMTEAPVNFDSYTERLIDVKATVRVQCLQLPEGKAKTGLQDALQVYVDTIALSEVAHRYYFRNHHPLKGEFALLTKYHLPRPATLDDPEGGYLDPEPKEDWYRRLWLIAKQKLRQTESAIAAK